MNLQSLLCGTDYVVLQENAPFERIEVENIVCDSKKAGHGCVFVCIRGAKHDGHDYIEEAWMRGTEVLIVEKTGRHGHLFDFPSGLTVFLVRDTREAYAQMAANYFGHPVEDLKVIGITGTKGKTSVAVMVQKMLENQGIRAGLIGTLGIFDGEEWIFTKNTTPDAFTIQEYFAKMKDKGCKYVVMEVSSQGMKQKRVYGIPFFIGVFTNLGEDHVGPGEHTSFNEYRYYKSRLFKVCRVGIGNLDDIQTGYMFRRTRCEKYGYTCQMEKKEAGIYGDSHILCGENIQLLMEDGIPVTHFTVKGISVCLQQPGRFNVYNALAALSVMECLKLPLDCCVKTLETVFVNGRMERIFCKKNIACYIDYAHNGMSLRQVLQTLRLYNPSRIILVFGCGGGRAKIRRLEMGEAAGMYADKIILTNDNPRDEEPNKIIQDIQEGIGKAKETTKEATDGKTQNQVEVIMDRPMAVAKAIQSARPGDIVLIAGKGHETYQEAGGRRYYMDDHELVRNAIACRKNYE